jgi:hypothetical protein
MICIDLSFAINVGSGELGTLGETTSAFYGILFRLGVRSGLGQGAIIEYHDLGFRILGDSTDIHISG